ncbi:MAG: hypothetical protein AAGI03_03135 [Pseudomonadota bacterium]
MTKPPEIPGHVSFSFAMRDSLPEHSFQSFERDAGRSKAAFTTAMAAQIPPAKPARFTYAEAKLPRADRPDPRPSFARKGTNDTDWFLPLAPEPATAQHKLSKEEFLKIRGQSQTKDRPRRHGR